MSTIATSPTFTERTHARQILAAIRTLQAIEQTRRVPTAEERTVLEQYGGFGPVANYLFPNPLTRTWRNPSWKAMGQELQVLLTPEEWRSAQQTVTTAYYTPQALINRLYETLIFLGLPGGTLILEPGMGSGGFLAAAPPHLHFKFLGIERDTISGRIARMLYPTHDIRIENFRDTVLADDSVDAVIGNFPFSDLTLRHWDMNMSLHEFFLAKSLDALKPGGILGVIITHYFLDRQRPLIRQRIAEQADFLGAVRLPSGALGATRVVADLLFLRKRFDREYPQHQSPDWFDTTLVALNGAEKPTIPINYYFIMRPEMLLGTLSSEDRLYGSETSYSVLPPSGDLLPQLRHATARLPAGAYAGAGQVQAVKAEGPVGIPVPANLPFLTEGSFFLSPERTAQSIPIFQVQHGRGVPVLYGGTPLNAAKGLVARRLGELLDLRDSARRVLQSQNEGWSDFERTNERALLRLTYSTFVAQYGPINKTTLAARKDGTLIRRMPNLAVFREDPDAMLVLALERYDEETGIATMAAIFSRDVIHHVAQTLTATSAEQALLLSLDHRGTVDLPYMATLYGKDPVTIVDELGALIYQDPVTRVWQMADAYLSGNVRSRLAIAEAAGQAWGHNADALRAVQPEDVLPSEIDANLGAPWIPVDVIHTFALALFNVRHFHITVAHERRDATWNLQGSNYVLDSVPATSDWGTTRINGVILLDQALNMRVPTVYDTIRAPDGKEQRVINQEATLAAREKQKQIKTRFKDWVFSDPLRAERLVRLYNDTYNNLRLRKFDGRHLTFPGMSPHITLRPHQKDAIWRIMSSGNTLLAHVVGSGKTYVQVAAAMKMRQAGLIRKPLFAVPNHMLEQFTRDCLQLYPNARVLMASNEDFTAERRKLLTAKIASDTWDAIITTHSAFERIGMSQEAQERFLRQHIDIYERMLVDEAVEYTDHDRYNHKAKSLALKQLEKQKERYELRLEELLAKERKDDGLVFDELGIDFLFVDECFPYDTPIKTDRGLLKIGDIVTHKLHVNILSRNSSTYALEWKPVTNWFANQRHGPLVEVTHEYGSFICTPQHKILVEGAGYRYAGELVPGNPLSFLRKDVYSPLHRQEQDPRQTLLPCVSSGEQNLNHGLPAVRQKFHLFGPWPSQASQETTALLHCALQDARTTHQPRKRAEISSLYAPDVGQFAFERTAQSSSSSLHDHQQSYEISGCTRESGPGSSSQKPSPPYTRRQWTATTSSSSAPCPSNGLDDRVSYTHQADMAVYARAAELLQSRSSRPQAQAGDRDRWEYAQRTESAGYGCQERPGIVTSRVVRVAVLQPGSDGEYRFGGRSHQVLYDLEVADNHNYFAHGILVSNCQQFKNLDTPTKMTRVAGIQSDGSQRAFDMALKCQYLQQKRPGRSIVFATGTPISNTIVEMYTMQRYLDPDGLREREIEHFDAWAATFGEVVELMEIAPDGKTLRNRSRFAKFVNLVELQQMFRHFTDVQTAEQLQLPRPILQDEKAQVIACPMSDEQKQLQDALVERYEKVRNGHVKPWEDNALAITTDGRKLALDSRVLSDEATDYSEAKIHALVDKVYALYQHPGTGGLLRTQIIFCDLGVHPTKWDFSLYEEVMRLLEEKGLPRARMAAIGEADTDARKHALLERMRQGSLCVLLGSTQKMGTGINVQDWLIALHHLDAPWKPAEVEQRDGRILRPGNNHPEVQIYRYVTKGSFDAFIWQALETKQRFIAQIMRGDNALRQLEDIGSTELSYAEVKAIASGNPAMLTMAETDAELQRLHVLNRHHADGQFLAGMRLRRLPDDIARLQAELEAIRQDLATLEAHPEPLFVFGGGAGRSFDDALETIGGRLARLPEIVPDALHTVICEYRGLDVGLSLYPYLPPEAYLSGGRMRHRASLDRKFHGPRAILNAIERLSKGLPGTHARATADLEARIAQAADYQQRQHLPFPLAGYEESLRLWGRRLTTLLAGGSGECTLDEVVGQITQLRAVHSKTVTAAVAHPINIAEATTTALLARVEEPPAQPLSDRPREAPDTQAAPTPVVMVDAERIDREPFRRKMRARPVHPDQLVLF